MLGLSVLVAAASIFVRSPPVSLRCPNGAVPERLDIFAANYGPLGTSGNLMLTEASLTSIPGSTSTQSLTPSEREELIRSIERAPPVPWAAGEYRAVLVIDMTCDGQLLPVQEAHAERPARPPSFADLLTHPSWDRVAEAAGNLDPRRRRTLAMTEAVLRVAQQGW